VLRHVLALITRIYVGLLPQVEQTPVWQLLCDRIEKGRALAACRLEEEEEEEAAAGGAG
jgi:hypothetical protein